uniref:Pyr_redox_2 domain-containing protein n=1 Tax=Rhabditophanes sp. KR3021 TaxID=114890 RepID=A0AC35UDR9_9BILA
MVAEGSLGYDLARSLVIGVNCGVRRELEIEELKKMVDEKGGKLTISWDLFKENYGRCYIEQATQSIIMNGLVLQSTDIPEESGDYIWDARKCSIGSKVCFALKDAVVKAKRLIPDIFNK